MLIHAKDCAIHQAPFCTCGALNRWITDETKHLLSNATNAARLAEAIAQLDGEPSRPKAA